MWHLPREIFGLAIESINTAKRLKKTQTVIAEKKAFKWEINIKDTLKNDGDNFLFLWVSLVFRMNNEYLVSISSSGLSHVIFHQTLLLCGCNLPTWYATCFYYQVIEIPNLELQFSYLKLRQRYKYLMGLEDQMKSVCTT